MAALLLVVSSLLNFSLGFYSFLKNSRKFLNVTFFLFAANIAGWILSIFVILEISRYLIWGKLPFIFAIYSLAFLFLFILGLGTRPLIRSWFVALALIIPTFISLFILFDHVIESVAVQDNFIVNTFGPWYFLYTLTANILALLCFITLIYQFKTNIGIEKLKIKYVAFGILLFVLPAIFTNLILPSFFNIWSYNTIGPFFSFFMISAMAYAIIRYHLMDIWVVIRLGTIYTSLFAIISFVYVLISGVIGQYTDGYLKTLIPSVLITFGFIPLKNFIENVTDRIFFRKQFRYQDIIRKFNEIAHAFTFDLDQLLQNFNQLITNDLKASHAAVFLTIPKENFIQRQVVTTTTTTTTTELGPDNPIIHFLHFHPDAVIDKELLKIQPSTHMSDVVLELDRLDFNLVFPIVSKEQLIGMYGIGPKKSQDPFGSEEIDLLQFFASESAHVIDNARYFEDLKKADAAKSKFISVTSHELRTPLTSILWNVEFLKSRNIKNKVVNEMLGYVYNSAEFINEHLDDMLTVLNIEEEKDGIFLKKERIIFSELLNEIIAGLKTDAEKKGIVFDIKLSKNLPAIFADRMKIKKVLRALLLNAIVYNRMGGQVHITADIQSLNGQPHFRCSVGDEGMGITEEERCSMYSTFYRSAAARLASPNGFGISLFIAKHFIEAHGGELWFVSGGRDRGTTFELKFPIELPKNEKENHSYY